uniref:TonB-dependent receptor n=1 Tax=Edaphosphingomonas laterariae TaxID=861865 RepID=UPI001FE92C4B|nr:TonB-dependent receptor [Sphingomonas laterariae]
MRSTARGKSSGRQHLIARIGDTLNLGANDTYTHRDLDDPGNAAFQPTGVPTHKGFAYADWSPIERLHVVPNIDIASDRWTVNTAGTRYYRTGSYVLANLRIDYELIDGLVVGVGGRNLFNDTYQLADGFPEPGRSFFLSVKAQY